MQIEQIKSRSNKPESIRQTQEYFSRLCFDTVFSINSKKNIAKLSEKTIRHLKSQNQQRRTLYRELVFNNVSEMISRALPLTTQFLGSPLANKLVRLFLSEHQPQSCFYRHIPRDFVEYLCGSFPQSFKTKKIKLKNKIKKLSSKTATPLFEDLIDYEFCQFDLIFRTNLGKLPEHTLSAQFDKAKAVFNPHIFLRQYNFTVQNIAEEKPNYKIRKTKNHILISRDPVSYRVGSLDLKKWHFDLLNAVMKKNSMTIAQIRKLAFVIPSCRKIDTETLLSFIYELTQKGILLALQ